MIRRFSFKNPSKNKKNDSYNFFKFLLNFSYHLKNDVASRGINYTMFFLFSSNFYIILPCLTPCHNCCQLLIKYNNFSGLSISVTYLIKNMLSSTYSLASLLIAFCVFIQMVSFFFTGSFKKTSL